MTYRQTFPFYMRFILYEQNICKHTVRILCVAGKGGTQKQDSQTKLNLNGRETTGNKEA